MNAPWSGAVVSVQPRIRLLRSFDERSHGYHGYVLRIDGTCAGARGEAGIAVGRAAHAKHRFRVGMETGSMEPFVETVQGRDFLLWSEELPFLPGRARARGSGERRTVVHRGRLGRRVGHGAPGA